MIIRTLHDLISLIYQPHLQQRSVQYFMVKLPNCLSFLNTSCLRAFVHCNFLWFPSGTPFKLCSTWLTTTLLSHLKSGIISSRRLLPEFQNGSRGLPLGISTLSRQFQGDHCRVISKQSV